MSDPDLSDMFDLNLERIGISAQSDRLFVLKRMKRLIEKSKNDDEKLQNKSDADASIGWENPQDESSEENPESEISDD